MKIKADYVNAPQWKELTVKSRLPEQLKCLDELAHNMWWAWNYEARDLWRSLDEKLYEEVLIKGEEELPTDNPKIRVAKVLSNNYEVVCQQIDQLATVSRTYDDMKVVKMMKLMVPEFKSNNSKYEIIDKELKR